MAYQSGDILVVVEGVVNGFESWSNTWAFTDVDTADEQAVVDNLHDFYDALTTTTTLCDQWETRNATLRRLSTSTSIIPTWTTLSGGNAGDLLPTQLAVRVSLTSVSGHKGGPFLSGWSVASLATDGDLFRSVDQTAIVNAVQALDGDVQSNGAFIGIHRPTGPEVVRAVRARVGARFDVMRSRGNDTPESYTGVDIG